MKTHLALNAFLVTVLLLSSFDEAARGQARPKYVIVSLGTLPGFAQSAAYGLNDRGEVVGALSSYRDDQPTHVFFWSKHRLHDLGTIPSPYGDMRFPHPFGIEKVSLNNHGLIVASWSVFFDGAYMGTRQVVSVRRRGHWQNLPLLPNSQDNGNAAVNERGDIGLTADHTSSTTHADFPPYDPPHAVLYRSRRSQDLGPGVASGLNKNGDVCGFVNRDAKGYARPIYVNAAETRVVIAFQTKGGRRTRLGAGMATAMNDLGVVVGITGVTATEQGYSFVKALPVQWQNGKLRRLPVHGKEPAVPAAINNRGQVVGGHWLWARGRQFDLNSAVSPRSGWANLHANAINDHGQIVGWGTLHGKRRAFLLSPS